jgi:triacylglycerol lipase
VSWRQALDESTLGRDIALTFPVFMYRGVIDQIVPPATEDATRAAYCKAGARVAWKVYPGDHILTVFEAIPDVLRYLDGRFRGRVAADDC